MNQTDQETIATIALLAALADGTQTQEETAQLAEVFQAARNDPARRSRPPPVAGKIDLRAPGPFRGRRPEDGL